MTNTYPRETVEFQAVTVTVNGQVVTDDVEFSITERDVRPTVWDVAVVNGSEIGFMVEGFDPGVWKVWARVTSAPEVPVVDCGFFIVT
jgi:hypothetical protein